MGQGSVEEIKRGSRLLRGTLPESLADPATGALAEADQVLLKFHGSYQQDDRDLREERRQQKLEPAWSYMIRTRTPGGVLTPAQWLGLDAIATRFANRTLRLTTRQAVQFHGVAKRHLKPVMQALHALLIDTRAACGDVNRNVMVSASAPYEAVHAQVLADAAALSAHLLPRTGAWREIWLDQPAQKKDEEEPIYGPTYLPRKFKIAFAIPPVNDVDVLAHDLGFIAIVEEGRLVGYVLTVGGGMGASHGDPQTYPVLAQTLGFATRDQVAAVAEAVVTTQRDWGNRVERKRARLKYTLEERGLAAFRAEVERRAGLALAPPRPFAFAHSGDRLGWYEGEDGLAQLTLHVPAGRIADGPASSFRLGLREIARVHRGSFRITPNQNLIIAGIAAGERRRIEALVRAHRIDGHARGSALRRAALACVALPTCPLAMAEGERYLPQLVDRIEPMLARHGLQDAPIHLRISGCPNGCSRPYLGEIALVGKGPGRYNLMLGADHRGQRLNACHLENVDEGEILAALDRLLARYAAEREDGERFGDFLVRAGVVSPPRAIAARLEAP